MSIKGIAIDFGGVYFTWNLNNFSAQMSKAVGVNRTKVKKAVKIGLKKMTTGKISEKQYWHNFCKVIGKDVNHKILRKITEDHFKPIKPVIALMKKLRKEYKIFLVTNQHALLDDLDKKYKFYKNFDLMICSHIVKTLKPQKKIYKLLIKKAKAKPSEIIFIDDMKKNVDAAKDLGMKGIVFKNVTQLKKDLSRQKVI